MPTAAHMRLRAEHGFTLPEILVTILLLSILAGLAIASLNGKDQLADDAEAKSNARTLLTHVQSCYVERKDYTLCDESSELPDLDGVVMGSAPGQAEVRRQGGLTTRNKVTIRAHSGARTAGVWHTFTLVRDAGQQTRSCESGDGDNAGGCQGGSW